jgi:hypothetical protein
VAETRPIAPRQALFGPTVRADRQLWCDFGAHAQQMASIAAAADPVFRTPTPLAKARLGEARKPLLGKANATPAQRATLTSLFAGPEGPTLARMAFSDAKPGMLATSLEAARPIASAHPRLAGFVTPLALHPDPRVAEAAVRFLFATGCDTPALYALDALRHPSEAVQLAVVAEVQASLRTRRDLGLAGRLLGWVKEGKASPTARAEAIRKVGEIGWLPATPEFRALTKDSSALVAGEALVALAAVAPGEAEPLLSIWLSSRESVRRAAGVRAAANALASRPERMATLLEPLRRDPQVAALVAQALAYARVEP